MSKPATEDLFTCSGRRNRKSYILASLLLIAIVLGLWCVFGVLASASGNYVLLIVPALLCLPAAFVGWMLGAQRCRDFGWTGWAILITLIPYVGGIFAIAIMFIPGNRGANRYGVDPHDSALGMAGF